jgi:hypothetical protein
MTALASMYLWCLGVDWTQASTLLGIMPGRKNAVLSCYKVCREFCEAELDVCRITAHYTQHEQQQHQSRTSHDGLKDDDRGLQRRESVPLLSHGDVMLDKVGNKRFRNSQQQSKEQAGHEHYGPSHGFLKCPRYKLGMPGCPCVGVYIIHKPSGGYLEPSVNAAIKKSPTKLGQYCVVMVEETSWRYCWPVWVFCFDYFLNTSPDIVSEMRYSNMQQKS